jgi:hypothetical protein
LIVLHPKHPRLVIKGINVKVVLIIHRLLCNISINKRGSLLFGSVWINEYVTSNIVSTDQALSTAVQSETILHLSEVVCATLKNQEFIDSIILQISEKVMQLIKPKIVKIVEECMKPHLETIKHIKDALILREIQNKDQNDQISSLKNKLVI